MNETTEDTLMKMEERYDMIKVKKNVYGDFISFKPVFTGQEDPSALFNYTKQNYVPNLVNKNKEKYYTHTVSPTHLRLREGILTQ